jgi:hypothetical protein
MKPAIKTSWLPILTSPGSPADFANYIVQETKKWAKVIKFADIQPI